MTNNRKQGHLCAFLTIFIWGTTFISTKILLTDMTPLQILFTRFVIGYLTLWIMYPHRCTLEDKKLERWFAGAGLCGITLYYLLENIALLYTQTTNVGVIISIAPFFYCFLKLKDHEGILQRALLLYRICFGNAWYLTYQHTG